MTSPPTSTLPAPLPLRAILEECAEMEVEERNLLLRNFLSHHWPDRAEMIMHYVGQTDNCVWYPQRWRPAHRVYPHPEGSPFDRLGLNMSPGLFNIAKTIIFSISKDESLNWDNLLTLKLSPYVILYACLDYNSPFPVSFDIQFFLDHLSHLIATGRTEDLFMRQNDVPNASLRFFDGKVVHDELNDPDDVLETLHTFMVSGGGQLHRLSVLPHVYLAADAKSTAAVYRTDDLKTFQPAFKRSFCLGPPSTHLLTLTDSQSRLADAALHAAVCWAPLWEGWAVNFQVPSVRAAWALNDSADFSDEFPALEALHTLAAHFCFNIHAGLVVPERRTACAIEAEELVHHMSLADELGDHPSPAFSEGSGFCHQAMDCVVNQYHTLGQVDRLWGTEQQRYMEILRADGFEGYTGPTLAPGLVYQKMRDDQIFEDSLASPPLSHPTPTSLGSWTNISSCAPFRASSSALTYSATAIGGLLAAASGASSHTLLEGSRTIRDLRDVAPTNGRLDSEPTIVATNHYDTFKFVRDSLERDDFEVTPSPSPWEEIMALDAESLQSTTPRPSSPQMLSRDDGDPFETIALERVDKYWEKRRSIAECRRRNERRARGREMRRLAILDDGHARAQRAPMVTFYSGPTEDPL